MNTGVDNKFYELGRVKVGAKATNYSKNATSCIISGCNFILRIHGRNTGYCYATRINLKLVRYFHEYFAVREQSILSYEADCVGNTVSDAIALWYYLDV